MTGDVLLIRPKLVPPPVPPHLVPRPHLYRRLDAGLDGRVTLVSAPGGAGKTTLLSAWVRHNTDGAGLTRFAWLSLDPADNDLPRFLAHLAGAMQHAVPDLHIAPSADAEATLVALTNGLAARDDRLVQVLDDYHLIEAKAVHDALAFFLDHLPHNAHLVISTRCEPPLPFARMQGRGESTRLGYADLCLGAREVEALLRATGVAVGDGTVGQMVERTEGWAAGVTMEAAALRDGVPDGGRRAILDYFHHEVLQPQPPERREFLLRTAIVDRLTAPLCDVLACDTPGGSQTMLQELEADNVFVRALDPARNSYRYHPLFAELLCNRLAQTRPELVTDLHRRAASWFEQAGAHAEAGKHALAGGAPVQDLDTTLTPREIEVLRLLATSLSAQAIADELFIAVSTVRSHTKSIYAKLQVHRRLDAVKRAREWKLIP